MLKTKEVVEFRELHDFLKSCEFSKECEIRYTFSHTHLPVGPSFHPTFFFRFSNVAEGDKQKVRAYFKQFTKFVTAYSGILHSDKDASIQGNYLIIEVCVPNRIVANMLRFSHDYLIRSSESDFYTNIF